MSRLHERLEAKRKLPTADTSHVVSTKTTRIARRDFLKTSAAAGGGLCIAAFVPELAARPVSNPDARRAQGQRRRCTVRRPQQRWSSKNHGEQSAWFLWKLHGRCQPSGVSVWLPIAHGDGS